MEEYKQPMQEQQDERGGISEALVCDIQFRNNSKTYYFDPDGIKIKTGDEVIIDTARGPEFGCCTAAEHTVAMREVVLPLRKVIRLATPEDKALNEENKEKEKRAFEVCLKKINEMELDMQLVSAEYAFDGSKILFFFTAEGRVDFRELVKALAAVFRTRIELRQIGMRDKAKMIGGFGICGRPFCCGQFLDDFQPVSIKMAKTQNLSLNPTKISGTCGRLMCCLKYEQEAYEDLIKTSPKPESLVDTIEGRGTVTELNLMAQTVKVRMEKNPEEIKCFKNCDICVLRNGKAKKTDPPIPEDFAPLSADRSAQLPYSRFERRCIIETPEEEEAVQAPASAEEAAAAPAEQTPQEAGKRRPRRRYKQKDKAGPAKVIVTPKQPKPEQKRQPRPKKQQVFSEKPPKAPTETADKPKPAKGKPHYRHNRRGKQQNGGKKKD